MKKAVVFLFIAVFMSGCMSVIQNRKITKINYTDDYNDKNVNNVAIIDFSKAPAAGGYDPSAIVDKFTAELVGSSLFQLVDRADIKKIMREFGFQVTSRSGGMLNEKTMQQLRALGADTILTGKLLKFREDRRGNFIIYSEAHLTAKLVQISTGKVIWSAELLRVDRSKKKKDEAESAEELLTDIIETMSVSLKTENKFRRFIKM